MKRLLLVIFLLVGGAAAYYLLAPSSEAQNPVPGQPSRPVAVSVAAAEQRAAPVDITTIGRVQTIASVAVKSRIDGQIMSVAVEDGQEVKAGDVLFTLDDRVYKATLHHAQAQLARDRVQLENARREAERQSALGRRDFASQQAIDQARTTAAALEATVKSDEAQVENAQAQLSYTVIRAPIDGRLGTINFKVGNTVKANDTTSLVTLNQIRPIYVSFSVPQRNFGEIQRAMAESSLAARAAIPSDPGKPLAGKLAYIENAIDPASSTLSVKAVFDNAESRLWPGQFVNVTLTLRVQPDAIVVPSEAVQAGQNGSFVFIVKPDSTAEVRHVTVDRILGDGKETVIADGLAAGEQVVTRGQLRLTDGTRVEIRGGETASGKPVT